MASKTSQRGDHAGQAGPPQGATGPGAAGALETAQTAAAAEPKTWAKAKAWAKAEVAARTAEASDPGETAEAGETGEAGETAEPGETPEAGEAYEAGESAEAKAAETAAVAEPAAGAGRRGLRVPALLALATVLLGGFGIFATVRAHDLRSSAASQNLALTGPDTTAVKDQVDAAVATIFSYRYNDTAATRRAAQSLLTGAAIRQYNRLFSLVERQAPAEKLVVTTKVTNSAVEFLTGDRARVLVFANQQDSRAGTSQTSYAGTMFAVTAVHSGGHWKIENIDTFTG
jgi:Mce-associated membrane protein